MFAPINEIVVTDNDNFLSSEESTQGADIWRQQKIIEHLYPYRGSSFLLTARPVPFIKQIAAVLIYDDIAL